MGAVATYQRIEPTTLASLRKKPQLVERFLLGQSGPGDAADSVAKVLAGPHGSAASIAAGLRSGNLLDSLRRPDAPPVDPTRAAELAKVQQQLAEQLATLNSLMGAGKRRRPAEIPLAEAPRLEIGKDWDDLHLVLCGTSEPAPSPLGDVVRGGKELGPDLGYGPCRFLTPPQVELAAEALVAISVQDFGARCRANARAELEGQLVNVFVGVRDYFATAARAKQAMLLALG